MSKLSKSITTFIKKHEDQGWFCHHCGGGILVHGWFAKGGKIERTCIFEPNGGDIRPIHRPWLRACMLVAVKRGQLRKSDTLVTKATLQHLIAKAVVEAEVELNDSWNAVILTREQHVQDNIDHLEERNKALEAEVHTLREQNLEDIKILASDHNDRVRELQKEHALETDDYEQQLAELNAKVAELLKKVPPPVPPAPKEKHVRIPVQVAVVSKVPAEKPMPPLSNLAAMAEHDRVKLPGVTMTPEPISEPALSLVPTPVTQEHTCDVCPTKPAEFMSKILFEDGSSRTAYSCSKGKQHLNKVFQKNLSGSKIAEGFSFKIFLKNKVRIQNQKEKKHA